MLHERREELVATMKNLHFEAFETFAHLPNKRTAQTSLYLADFKILYLESRLRNYWFFNISLYYLHSLFFNIHSILLLLMVQSYELDVVCKVGNAYSFINLLFI